jgi:hypothetical protein
LWD